MRHFLVLFFWKKPQSFPQPCPPPNPTPHPVCARQLLKGAIPPPHRVWRGDLRVGFPKGFDWVWAQANTFCNFSVHRHPWSNGTPTTVFSGTRTTFFVLTTPSIPNGSALTGRFLPPLWGRIHFPFFCILLNNIGNHPVRDYQSIFINILCFVGSTRKGVRNSNLN